MDYNPLCARPHHVLIDVITLMLERGLDDLSPSETTAPTPLQASSRQSSFALVMDDERLVGILTERDIVRFTAQGISFSEVVVADVMTRHVTTIHKSEIEDVFNVLHVFRQQRIRHVPVVNDLEQVVGVLTQSDLHSSLQVTDLLRVRRAGEVMSSRVISASPDATIFQLAELMHTHRVSGVVIVESGPSTDSTPATVQPIGIVTERDIVQFKALGLACHLIDAGSVMSTPLVCYQVDDDLWTIHQAMERMRARRLVITNASNHLVGIITQSSILEMLNPMEMHHTIHILQRQLQGFQDERIQVLQQRSSQLEENLNLAENLFKAVFHNAFQFIGLLAPDGTVLEVNQPVLDAGNLQREDVIGQPFWETYWWTMVPETQQELREAIAIAAQGEFIRYDLEVVGKDGEMITLDFSLKPVFNNSGVLQFIIPEGRDVTELRLAHDALKKSEQQYANLAQDLELRVNQRTAELESLKEQYQLFYQKTPVMLHAIDRQGNIRYVSDYWLTTLGYELDEVLGHKSTEFLTPDSRYYAETVVLPEYFKTGECSDIPYQIMKKNGEIIDVLLSATSHQDVWGEQLSLAVMVDVTASNKELFREKELALVTLHSIGDAVITTDAEGYIQYFNPVAEELTGWPADQACGLPLTSVFCIVNEITRAPVQNPVERVLREGVTSGLANHTILISKNGTEHSIEDSAAPIRARDGEMIGAVTVFHDVTQSRQMARELSWQASHDSLTGLPNRLYFEQALVDLVDDLHHTDQADQIHALCYLDLDQFKVVNDTCGHVAGDELLRRVAHMLKQQIRNSDTLARLGGDEFGVLLRHCQLAAAVAIAEKLRTAVQSFRFSWRDRTFGLGVSIGLVSIDQGSSTFENILSAADSACYMAKEQGRNRVHVYQIDDSELLRQRGEQQWSLRIRRALEENRFQLYHQAISDASDETGHPSHYEVLIRMVDEEGKVIPPGAFIPAAERYDLMNDIDQWVIQSFFAWFERSRTTTLLSEQSADLSTDHPEHLSQNTFEKSRPALYQPPYPHKSGVLKVKAPQNWGL